MLLLIATFNLTFTSCGDDDKDDPSKPETITSQIISGSASESNIVEIGDGSPCPYFVWNNANDPIINIKNEPGSGYSNIAIASVGKITKLSDIKSAPSTGWSSNQKLENGGGYVITYTYGGKPYYMRLYITLNMNAAGVLVGINYQFQHFTPSNL